MNQHLNFVIYNLCKLNNTFVIDRIEIKTRNQLIPLLIENVSWLNIVDWF